MENSIKYNKLIRGKIPEIIERTGKKPVYEILDEKEYRVSPYIIDEGSEARKDQVIEVVYCINSREKSPIKGVFVKIALQAYIQRKSISTLQKKDKFMVIGLKIL